MKHSTFVTMYNFQRISVTPLLQKYVQGFWILERVSENLNPLIIVPDGYPELIFNIKSKFQLLGKDDDFFNPSAGLIGQLTQSSEMKAPLGAKAIFVKLYPWTLFALFQVPTYLFKNSSLDFSDLENENDFIQLGKRIESCGNILQAIQLIENFFLEKIDLNISISPILKFAILEIFKTKGMVNMEVLCRKIKVSRRYLEILFKTQIGLSPTRYARIIKIKKISQQLFQNPPESLTELAQQWSFFDQSHFNREFKKNTNLTPRQFLKYIQNFPLDKKESYLNQWDYS